MSHSPLVIAIDGPSGSGKSSVSRAVAARLGLAYLDTGATYRAATWWCLHESIDLTDSVAVAAAVRAMPLTMGVDPGREILEVGVDLQHAGPDHARDVRGKSPAAALAAAPEQAAVWRQAEIVQHEARVGDA